jgi:hypothetical protein
LASGHRLILQYHIPHSRHAFVRPSRVPGSKKKHHAISSKTSILSSVPSPLRIAHHLSLLHRTAVHDIVRLCSVILVPQTSCMRDFLKAISGARKVDENIYARKGLLCPSRAFPSHCHELSDLQYSKQQQSTASSISISIIDCKLNPVHLMICIIYARSVRERLCLSISALATPSVTFDFSNFEMHMMCRFVL